MRENKLSIVINKPPHSVFEFSTNPQNTHLWASSIKEETTDEYPPKIGTIYKNRWDTPTWDSYKVVEFEQDKLFTLSDMNDDYHVRYTYKAVGEKTEMEYFEWVTEGELSNPYMNEVLEQLKSIMETG